MNREGLPTARIRTLDREGRVTEAVLLDPSAARRVAGNIEVALENFATVIDPTGGVSHGGKACLGTEDGSIEIAWSVSGRFEYL